jgi:hypothetical protein
LNVDRCRQAEIQDLSDDVGRLKEELDTGKSLRQLCAEVSNEFFSRTMSFT